MESAVRKIDDLAPCSISKARSKEFIWGLGKEFQGVSRSKEFVPYRPQEAVE
jgi:hypothetical protein